MARSSYLRYILVLLATILSCVSTALAEPVESSQDSLELPQGWALIGQRITLESKGITIHNGQLTSSTSAILFDYAALRREDGLWLADLNGVSVQYSCCEHLNVQRVALAWDEQRLWVRYSPSLWVPIPSTASFTAISVRMRDEDIAVESELSLGKVGVASMGPYWKLSNTIGDFLFGYDLFQQQPYGALQLFDRVTLADTTIGYSINEQWGVNNEWLIDARPRAFNVPSFLWFQHSAARIDLGFGSTGMSAAISSDKSWALKGLVVSSNSSAQFIGGKPIVFVNEQWSFIHRWEHLTLSSQLIIQYFDEVAKVTQAALLPFWSSIGGLDQQLEIGPSIGWDGGLLYGAEGLWQAASKKWLAQAYVQTLQGSDGASVEGEFSASNGVFSVYARGNPRSRYGWIGAHLSQGFLRVGGNVTGDQIVGGLSFARRWSQFTIFGEVLPNELVFGGEWKRPCRCWPIRIDFRTINQVTQVNFSILSPSTPSSLRQLQFMEL